MQPYLSNKVLDFSISNEKGPTNNQKLVGPSYITDNS